MSSNGRISVAKPMPAAQSIEVPVQIHFETPSSPQALRIAGRGELERTMIQETELTVAEGTRAIARIGTAVTFFASDASGRMLRIRDEASEGSEHQEIVNAFLEQNLPEFLGDIGQAARTASKRIVDAVSHDHHDGVDRAAKPGFMQRVGLRSRS